MKKIIIDVFCLLSVVVISCNSSPIDRIEKELSTKNNDSVVREVPIRILEPGIIRKIQYDKVRTVGLPSLENGFTKFQLRIWEDLEHLTGRIIILKYTNDQWTAELCKYKYESTGSYFPDSLSGQIFPLKKPKSGWNKFLNKLLNLQILTLPDFDSIHDYNVASDELGVTVEIANEKYYRFYEYTDPYERVNRIPYAKKMAQILELIKEEFSLL